MLECVRCGDLMFGLTKKVESKDINEAYQEFLDNPDIILLNADEYRDFETLHIVDSQNLPLRVINSDAKSLLDQDAIYYVYAILEGTAFEACRRLARLGFTAYNLGSQQYFKGPEEGLKKKNRKRRK